MIHHTGAGNAHVDDAVRLANAVERARHKGIVLHSVAEHHQLGAAQTVPAFRQVGRLFDDAAHTGHRVHVDAGPRAAHVDAGAHQIGLGQRLGDGAQQQLVAFAEALLHQRGIAAQKVHAAGLARPVKGQGEGNVILRVAAARHQRHGGDGDALVDDGDAEFAFDIPARLHQLFRTAADFVVNFVTAALGILADAVQQGDAHGDGADVQMLLVDHVDGVKNVLQIQHGSASAYSLCMASKMSSR